MKVKKIDFLFFVEHEARELMAIRRLADALHKHGYTSAIQSVFGVGPALLRIEPKVVLIPYIARNHDAFLKLINSYYNGNAKVISLNHEQILNKANKDFKKPTSSFLKQEIIHLSWGGDFTQYLLQSDVPKENIVELPKLSYTCYNHNPKTDVIENERDFYNEISQSEKSVFFPLNFNWAFISEETKLEKIKRGYSPELASVYNQFSIELFDITIEAILKFARENGDSLIVIRPHPGISTNQYKDRIKFLGLELSDNIRISDKLNIYILSDITDLIISNWSTTIYDGHLNGFQCYQFLLRPIPPELGIDTFDEVSQIDSLNISVDKLLSKENSKNSTLDVLGEYCSFLTAILNDTNKELNLRKPDKARSGRLMFFLLGVRNKLLKLKSIKSNKLKQADFFKTIFND